MNNTIPFHSAPHAPQITVDVNILSMLKQAASRLSEMASENVYLSAIGPDMELTIIMEEDAPSILPCFDEDDALISVKGAPLFISYNPAQVLKLAGKRYLTGPVIFYRTDGHSMARTRSRRSSPEKQNTAHIRSSRQKNSRSTCWWTFRQNSPRAKAKATHGGQNAII